MASSVAASARLQGRSAWCGQGPKGHFPELAALAESRSDHDFRHCFNALTFRNLGLSHLTVPQESTMHKTTRISAAFLLRFTGLTAAGLCAQSGAALAQVVAKPPIAQAWIDVATFSGMSMPMGGGMGGGAGGGALGALGSLFGGSTGGAGNNTFGNTAGGGSGSWVDVTLLTRNNPSLSDAQQAVPSAFMAPALKLAAPQETRGRAPDNDETVVEHEQERPKGRLLLFWGCGANAGAGQPKVLDMATASTSDLARFFVSRRATQRGTHSMPGRPVWPSPQDRRMLPEGASLAGQHSFSGSGVPADFRFQIPPAQDLMPALNVQNKDAGGATDLSWNAAPNTRAYFAAAMGANEKEEMVIWTSSQLPDTGMGLMDYQTNAAVDKWLGEKVLLSANTTQCTVPKGVFPSGGGAMLRVIAYGNELNLAHPPRPADPRAAWDPVWAVKVRVKSMSTSLLGMDGASMMGGTRPQRQPQADGQPGAAASTEPAEKPASPLNLIRGLFGR